MVKRKNCIKETSYNCGATCISAKKVCNVDGLQGQSVSILSRLTAAIESANVVSDNNNQPNQMGTTSIVRVKQITEPRLGQLGWNQGVLIKYDDTGDEEWVNHYNYGTKPLIKGETYKYDYKTDSIVSRVKKKNNDLSNLKTPKPADSELTDKQRAITNVESILKSRHPNLKIRRLPNSDVIMVDDITTRLLDSGIFTVPFNMDFNVKRTLKDLNAEGF